MNEVKIALVRRALCVAESHFKQIQERVTKRKKALDATRRGNSVLLLHVCAQFTYTETAHALSERHIDWIEYLIRVPC